VSYPSDYRLLVAAFHDLAAWAHNEASLAIDHRSPHPVKVEIGVLARMAQASAGEPLPDAVYDGWQGIYRRLDRLVFGERSGRPDDDFKKLVSRYIARVSALNLAAIELARTVRQPGHTVQRSSDDDFYGRVEALRQRIEGEDETPWSTAIDHAVRGGATSGEILGELRVVLAWMRLSDVSKRLAVCDQLDLRLQEIDAAFHARGQP
jgi:hypothetical protein